MTQSPGDVTTFPFRPWVRSTCRRAMLWGLGIVLLLGLGVAWLRSPGGGNPERAFEVLLLYALLFWLTLLKIWWTAGRPAVRIDGEGIAYQPLHTFTLRKIPYGRILSCGPRPGSEALRFVVEGPRQAREFFLNLGVVKGKHALLDLLAARLEAAGLEQAAERKALWSRPGFAEESSR